MKCPHCSRPVDHEADTCYSCGYSLANAEAIYGRNYVQMTRLHDAAHCLRKPERDAVDDVLDQLEFRFPQLLFCCYLGALSENMRLNELGFWLLNHAEVRGVDYARPNENAVLVLIDVNSKQAGIAFGYYIEHLLREDEGYRCLQAARPYLVNGQFGQGLTVLFRKIGRALSRRAREIQKSPPGAAREPDGESSLPPMNDFHALEAQRPAVAGATAAGGGGRLFS